MLVLCGWCAGETHRRYASARSAALRRTEALLQRLRQEIAYRHVELNRLYRQLGAEEARPLELSPGGEAQPGGSFQQMKPPGCFTPEEKACFIECMAGLGRTEAQQECERLDYYIQRFAGFRQEAGQKEREAAALDRRLGLAAGTMLALLFL